MLFKNKYKEFADDENFNGSSNWRKKFEPVKNTDKRDSNHVIDIKNNMV